jgi:hypothetical protein
MQNLISVNQLTEIDNEPRILDVDLAERLAFERPRVIRELIARNRDELEAFGSLPCRTANPTAQGGRPGNAYYLNEGQALVICALSRTEKAAQVRKLLIDVFMAYRQGKLVHVKEHRRRLPRSGKIGKGSAEFQALYEDAKTYLQVTAFERDDVLASLMARMTMIERAMIN